MIPVSAKPRHLLCLLLLGAMLVSNAACQRLPSEPTPTAETAAETLPVTATAVKTQTAKISVSPAVTATTLPHHLALTAGDVDGMEIRIWHAQRNEVKAELEALVETFNRENSYNLTVVLHQELSDSIMNDALLEPPSKDDFPHIVIAESPWIKNWQSIGYPMTILQPYIDHPTQGFLALDIPPIIPQMLEQEKYNGNLTALPLWHQPELLFYNQTFGQMLGYTQSPRTQKDFADQACAAWAANLADADSENDGTGGWILTDSSGALISWMMATEPENADFSQFPQEKDGAIFYETVNWIRDLYAQGCVWQSRLPDPYDYFSNHNALFYSGTFEDISIQERSFNASEKNSLDDWTLIPYPVSDSSTEESDSLVFSTAVSAGIFTGTAEEQFASWLFLSWLMQPERLTRLALAAQAWPVQDTKEVNAEFTAGTSPEMAETLNLRELIQPSGLPAKWMTDELVLSDGFSHAFSPGVDSSAIPGIWDQILSTLTEIEEIP